MKTKDFFQTRDEYGFLKHPDVMGDPSREIRNPDTMITTGAWVLIKHRIAVQAAPVPYGIYWAIPYTFTITAEGKTKTFTGVDEYGRQCALVYTPYEVKIFPDEYSILTEEKLEEYKANGWELHETNVKLKRSLNLQLIEKGRTLCEEEREIIWALMLEGLSERQACEEYFLTKHSNDNNTAICYLLPPKLQSEMEQTFG